MHLYPLSLQPIELFPQRPLDTLFVISLYHYPAYSKYFNSRTAATMLSKSPFVSIASTLPLLTLSHPASFTVVPAQKFPVMPRQTNSSENGVSLPHTTKKFYAHALCNAEQEQIEQEAWYGAAVYAYAMIWWHANGPYQDTRDIYMGNDSRGPIVDVPKGGHDTSTPLAFNTPLANNCFSPDNIWGAVNVHDSSTWPEKQKIFIMCEEPAAELMTKVLNQGVCDPAPQGFELGTYVWVDFFFIKGVYY